MGVSTDGIICFGIALEEGTELPWEDEKYDGEIEEWWREITGFKDEWNPWTEDGEYRDGIDHNDPRFEKYYEDRRDWLKTHPIPVVPVNCCSHDYLMWILAVPGTVLRCARGYPSEFDPFTTLKATPSQAADLLIFCREYGIELEDGAYPKWYLASYWG